MPEVTAQPAGSFCWIELNTTNPAAAKEFYCPLFGWEAQDTPAGPDMVYTMLSLGGKSVGALCAMQAEAGAHGVPPHWMSYITVESADAGAAKAAELGATVLAGPFDVMDLGRMATIQDPQGAAFSIWEAKASAGFQLSGEFGSFVWDELWAGDTDKARQFYTAMFGWGTKENPDLAPGGYTEWQNGGQSVGGMMAITPDMGPVPPNWLPYILVADCDATADKAQSLGGVAVMPPMDIPTVGRFSVLQDPQGASFGVITLSMPA